MVKRDGQGMLDGEWRWEGEDGVVPIEREQAMGGELGRDVMKPGRSLIRILLSGWPPRKSCAGNVVTYPPQQALNYC